MRHQGVVGARVGVLMWGTLLLAAACSDAVVDAGATPSSLVAETSTAAMSSTSGATAPNITATTSTTATDDPSGAGKRVNIPGTRVWLIPPPGFAPSSQVASLVDASGAVIFAIELPGPFSEVAPGLTDGAWAAQGIQVDERRELTLDGADQALLIIADQTASVGTVRKAMLVVGVGEVTAMVIGQVGNNPEVEADIVVALLTVSFDPDGETDPTEGLAFVLEPQPPLRFAAVVVNGALYNTSGTIPSADELEPLLVVAPSLGAVPGSDAEPFARVKLEETAQLAGIEVETVAEITVGRLIGVELVATATHESGATVMVYQALLLTEDGYVIALGRCRIEEREAMLPVFRESTATFQFR